MPQKLDDYTLTKTLGQGMTAKVKLGTHKNGETYAIKIFELKNPQMQKLGLKYLHDEVDIYKDLQHQNIVRLFEFKENADMIMNSGAVTKVHYIVLEFVSGGEIFDYVALRPFSPEICRFYFTQMLQAMHAVHSQGASHRDLKLENILLDNEYNTKIADFGFATRTEGKDGSGFLHTYLGTKTYMAPEIKAQQPYMGNVVDLFALAVILFSLYAGHPPFDDAIPKDPNYMYLVKFRPDDFWLQHESRHPAGFFSEEFKDLLTAMLAYTPAARLSMADVIGHPWMQNGSTATHEEVKQEFKKREEEIMNQKANEAAATVQQPRQPRGVHRALNGTVFYEDYDEVPDSIRNDPKINLKQLDMKKYEPPPVRKTTQIFTSYNGIEILQDIEQALEGLGASYFGMEDETLSQETEDLKPFKMHDRKWRLTFSLKGRLIGEQTDEEKQKYGEIEAQVVVFQIDIKKVDSDVNCIDFTRVAGDTQIFMQRYFELKEMLSRLNDRVIS